MSDEGITAPTTRVASMPFPVARPAASSQQRSGSDPAPMGAMGPLELAAYKADWRASSRYRRHVAEVAAAREHELLVRRLEEEALIAAEKAMHASGKKSGGGFGGHPVVQISLFNSYLGSENRLESQRARQPTSNSL